MNNKILLLTFSITSLALAETDFPAKSDFNIINQFLYATGLIRYASKDRCDAHLAQALEKKMPTYACYLMNSCGATLPADWAEGQTEVEMDELLEKAVWQKNWQVVEIALNAGASPYRKTKHYPLPILSIALYQQDPVIIWMLTGRSNPNNHDSDQLKEYIKSHGYKSGNFSIHWKGKECNITLKEPLV